MITKKRKYIYAGVIIFCLIAALVVVSLNQPSLPETDIALKNNLPPTSSVSRSENGAGSPNITVFPQNSNFDLSIFESNSKFRSLDDYLPLEITIGDLGRVNPFIPY